MRTMVSSFLGEKSPQNRDIEQIHTMKTIVKTELPDSTEEVLISSLHPMAEEGDENSRGKEFSMSFPFIKSQRKYPEEKRRTLKLKTQNVLMQDPLSIIKKQGDLSTKYCKRSLFFFTRKSAFRLWCLHSIHNPWFEVVVQVIILIHLIVFGFFDFKNPSNPYNDNIKMLTQVFCIWSMIEFFIKAAATGLILPERSFLRNSLNAIEFLCIILAISYPSYFRELTSFRMLRLIFSLNKLKFLKGLNKMYSIGANSYWQFFFLLLILLLLTVLFGLFSLGLWAETLYSRCRTTQQPLGNGTWPIVANSSLPCSSNDYCPEGTYCGNTLVYRRLNNLPMDQGTLNLEVKSQEMRWGNIGFTSLSSSLLTIMQVISMDRWGEILRVYSMNNLQILSSLFFLAIVIICSFFISNLCVAIMIENLKKSDSPDLLRPSLLRNLKLLRRIKTADFFIKLETRFAFMNLFRPAFWRAKYKRAHEAYLNSKSILIKERESRHFVSPLQKMMHWTYTTPGFTISIYLIILLNMFCQAFISEQNRQNPVVYWMQRFALLAYTFEAIIIIGIYTPFEIWKDKLKAISCALTLLNVIEFAVNGTMAFLVCRILCFFWIIEIMGGESLQFLIKACKACIVVLLNFIVLMTAVIYFFSLLARGTFAGKLNLEKFHVSALDQRGDFMLNFDDMASAFLSIVQIICGNGWSNLLYASLEAKGLAVTLLHFGSWIIVGRFLLLNLLIAAFLIAFEDVRTDLQHQKLKSIVILNVFRHQRKLSHSTGEIPNVGGAGGEEPFHRRQGGQDTALVMALAGSGNADAEDTRKDFSLNQIIYNLNSYKRRDLMSLPSSEERRSLDDEVREVEEELTDRWNGEPLSSARPLNQISLSYADSQSPRYDSGSIRKYNSMNRGGNCLRRLIKHCKTSSIFIFRPNSYCRRLATHWLEEKWWRNFSLLIDISLLVFMGIVGQSNTQNYVFQSIDVAFTFLYGINVFFHVVSVGLVYNSSNTWDAYMAKPSQALEFIVLMASVLFHVRGIETLTVLQGISGLLEFFKMMRCLRIFRSLSQSSYSIFLSYPILPVIFPLVNTLILLSVFIFISATIATNLYAGKIKVCQFTSGSELFLDHEQECTIKGGIWASTLPNFDDISNSVLSLTFLATGQRWFYFIERIKSLRLPYTLAHCVLFTGFLVFCQIFSLNFLQSVVVDTFKSLRDESRGHLLLSVEERDWIDMQYSMMKRKPPVIVPIPDNSLRSKAYKLIKARAFEVAICTILFTNIVLVALFNAYYSADGISIFRTFSIVYIIIYGVEFALKFLALGRSYFDSLWNSIDFCLLIVGLSLSVYSFGAEWVEVPSSIFAFRIVRLFTFIETCQVSSSLRIVIETVSNLIRIFSKIGAQIILFLVLFAIISTQLFSSVQPQKLISTDYNFSSFSGAFTLLVSASNAEQWDELLLELTNSQLPGCSSSPGFLTFVHGVQPGCGSWLGYPFMLCFFFIMRVVILNQFLGVAIDYFLETKRELNAPISKDHIERLLLKWSQYDPEGTGFLSPENFGFLLFELPPPIGCRSEEDDSTKHLEHIGKKEILVAPNKRVVLTKRQLLIAMRDFNLPVYRYNNQPMVHFRDVCIRLSQQAVMLKYQIRSLDITNEFIAKMVVNKWEAAYPIIPEVLKEERDRILKDFLKLGPAGSTPHATLHNPTLALLSAITKSLRKSKSLRRDSDNEELRLLLEKRLTVADYFAAHSIIDIVRKKKEERREREQYERSRQRVLIQCEEIEIRRHILKKCSSRGKQVVHAKSQSPGFLRRGTINMALDAKVYLRKELENFGFKEDEVKQDIQPRRSILGIVIQEEDKEEKESQESEERTPFANNFLGLPPSELLKKPLSERDIKGTKGQRFFPLGRALDSLVSPMNLRKREPTILKENHWLDGFEKEVDDKCIKPIFVVEKFEDSLSEYLAVGGRNIRNGGSRNLEPRERQGTNSSTPYEPVMRRGLRRVSESRTCETGEGLNSLSVIKDSGK